MTDHNSLPRHLLAAAVLIACNCVCAPARAADPVWVVTTLAGTGGQAGAVDGTGAAARFNLPSGLAVDSAGNVYVADHENSVIRKITSAGVVTVFAGVTGATGSTDGAAATARFNHPYGLALDSSGNLYVADMWNCAIRKITPAGAVSTLAGQPGSAGSADGSGSTARFRYPRALTVSSSGDVYVADTDNHTIRKITSAGVVSTLAGTAGTTGATDDTGTAARFNYPAGIAFDASGNLIVSDEQNHCLRKVTPAGVVTLHAGTVGLSGTGDGTLATARFSYPAGLASNATGDLFLAEGSSVIRKIAADGTVTTLAGSGWQSGTTDASGSGARFDNPRAIATGADGLLFVADAKNHTIRKLEAIAPATIVTAPAAITTLTVGQALSLSITLDTSHSPTTYQWSRNGTALPGATSATYSVASASRDDAGSYTVAFSRAGVTTTSPIALVAIGTATEPAIKSAVAPLLAVEYPVFRDPLNSKYPATPATDSEAIAGRVGNACGPTGVANILRYWQHPQRGTGSRTFSDRLNCTWSFNFAATTLDYAAMPETVTSASPAAQIEAVATLMYAAAVAMHDHYRSGAGAGVINGFKTHLGYSRFAQQALRAHYTDAQWEALYKSELSAGRPLLMSGVEPGVGGHWFICDGYNDSGLFHIRWDYGTSYDEWLPLNGFKPYVADQTAMIGLQPATDSLPAFAQQPQSQSLAPGASTTLSTAATSPAGGATPTYQWQCNGANVSGGTDATLALANLQPAATGLYTAVAANGSVTSVSNPAIVGLLSSAKITGEGTSVGENVLHPNGNTFDQVLLSGTAEAITCDHAQNQITRTSFIDLNNDIVQVEFSGPGTLSLVLTDATGPAAPVNYNQPTVSYMKGHAGIVITGATEATNVSVFTVGRATAFDRTGTYNILKPADAAAGNDPAKNGSPLFDGHAATAYDGIADLAFIAIQSANGKFGGVRAANANFFAHRGFTGVYAPGVTFTGPLYLGDVSAFDSASPVIVVGSVANARITGGSLLQDNGQPVRVDGLTQLLFAAGSDSHGHLFPAQTNKARLERNGVEVTSQIVVNP